MMELPRTLLSSVTFTKLGRELHAALGARIKQTTAKIAERRKRIVALRTAHEITDADMISLLEQQRSNDRAAFYNVSSVPVGAGRKGNAAVETTRAIPAGVVANMVQESDLIRDEESAVRKWEITHRNMDTKKKHAVSLSDLEFLGF